MEKEFLSTRENIREKEYYLCGPSGMIEALRELLKKYEVPDKRVKFDEF